VGRGPRVERRKDGGLVLRDLPPAIGLALRELRELLRPDGEGRPARLAGSPYAGDEEGDGHWRRHAEPELRHLFESARTTVLRDLEGLAPESIFRGGLRLPIPAKHVAAWLSTLAGVRVALGDRHGITAFEMDAGFPTDIKDARDRAVLLVHLLGWVQGLLIDPEEEPGPGE